MSRVTMVALALLLLPAGALAKKPKPPSGDSEAKVRELLELMHAGDLGVQAMHNMAETLARTQPLPAGFVEALEAEATPQVFVDLAVPIYQAHLSDADLDAAIAFYSSPEGQNWVDAMPAINEEAMQAGSVLGQKLAMKVLQRLMTEPPPSEPPPAPK